MHEQARKIWRGLGLDPGAVLFTVCVETNCKD